MLLLVQLILGLLAEDFTVTDLLQNIGSDRAMLLFLEVVVRVFEVLRPVLARVSVHTRLKSFLVVVNFLLVFFRVMGDISFVFELLLNPAEFNSALVGSL